MAHGVYVGLHFNANLVCPSVCLSETYIRNYIRAVISKASTRILKPQHRQTVHWENQVQCQLAKGITVNTPILDQTIKTKTFTY